MKRAFGDSLQARWQDGKFVCVGLDVDADKLPYSLNEVSETAERVRAFTRGIVDATHSYACAYKLNSAHYERLGYEGLVALKSTIAYIHENHPDIPVILDAKRGDIDVTNEYYAHAVFEELDADAITVHPYMGGRSLEPFLSRKDKGVIVMAVNSTPGAGEFQDIAVGSKDTPLYEYICRRVAKNWNKNGNCAVTASALDIEKLRRVRAAVGEMPILLLGVGAQGGDVTKCVQAGRAKRSRGLIINASRSILYASSGKDYLIAAEEAARKMNDAIMREYGA